MPTSQNSIGRQVLEPVQFISKIVQDADTGWAFVPLVGSGLSSPSGIIMGMEFTNYLAFTVYLVLADPQGREKTHGEGVPSRWDLIMQGWPPLPTEKEVEDARKWIHKQFVELCAGLHLEPNYDSGDKKSIKSLSLKRHQPPSQELVTVLTHPLIPTILASEDQVPTDEKARQFINLLAKSASEDFRGSFSVDELVKNPAKSYFQRIHEMGIRSLHDWRETLVFLASIRVQDTSQKLSLSKSPDTSIIDAFNTTITRDRQPNLGHKMLAHLASCLRIQTILTTNFDTLIEDAYRQLSLRIRVLPVSAKGQLPPARTVAADDSLVKLHGEAHDTRADLTLDEEPSPEDLEIFSSYLTRGGGHPTRGNPRDSKRLLVIGYSGSDFRCVQMIKRWLENAHDRPIVYWICFSQGDVRKVSQIFSAPQFKGQLRVTRTTRPDLLLYELYQRINLSLPPGGLTYEFSHVVAPRGLKDSSWDQQTISAVLDCGRELSSLIEASRVIVGHQCQMKDVRRLARDAHVSLLAEELTKLMKDTRPHPSPQATGKHVPKHYPKIVKWKPWYRLAHNRKKTYAEQVSPDFEHNYVSPLVIDCLGGVVRATAIASERVARDYGLRVFWMETQDYIDVDAMIRDFFRSLALRFGVFQRQHVTTHPFQGSFSHPQSLHTQKLSANEWKANAKKLGKHLIRTLTEYRADAKTVRLIIYGRDSYGSCSGLIPRPWTKQNAGDAELNALHCFIEGLALAGVQVIYFPLLQTRATERSGRIDSICHKSQISTNLSDSEQVRAAIDNHLKETETWRTWPSDSILDNAVDELGQFVFAREQMSEYSIFTDQLKECLDPYVTLNQSTTAPEKFHPQATAELFLKANRRHLTFLYAITLFRHSRHPNALCSEGTFQCPFRHNTLAIDNDFLRAEESNEWTAAIRDAGVFLSKPGGASWMHRDSRLAIQGILESIPWRDLQESVPLNTPKETIDQDGHVDGSHMQYDNGVSRDYSFALECRARLHFWIGDWYLKAFCSSGHLTPVIEAVHHQVMAAYYSPFAQPKYSSAESSQCPNPTREEVHQYQLLLFCSALNEGGKTLLLASNAMKLWQASPLDASWMNDRHQKEIEEHLRRVIAHFERQRNSTSDGDAKSAPKRALEDFLTILESTCKMLTIEGGGDREAFEGATLNTYSTIRRNEIDERTESLSNTGVPRSTGSGIDSPHPEQSSRPRLHLSHSWETVNLDQPNFSNTISELFETLGATEVFATLMKFSDVPLPDGVIHEWSKLKAGWKHRISGQTIKLQKMIWLLGEASYLLLRRAKLSFHSDGRINQSLWQQSTVLCNLGIDMCKHLPPAELQFDLNARVKLHSLYSVGLGNLGRFFEANRHLNEAQAILSKQATSNEADFAILCLRRAEVRLTECFFISMYLPHKIRGARKQPASSLSPEGTVKTALLNAHLGSPQVRLIDGDDRHQGWNVKRLLEYLRPDGSKPIGFVPARVAECIRKGGSKRSQATTDASATSNSGSPARTLPGDEHLMRLYASTLDEAVALLDQAEKGLCGKSQNALWWSRLYTLRLRVYGLLGPFGEEAESCLIRRKYSSDMGIHENFNNALRIAADDPFRMLRALKYFYDANDWHLGFFRKKTEWNSGSKERTFLPDTFELADIALSELSRFGRSRQNGRQIDQHSLLGKAIRRLWQSRRKKSSTT